jgi:16S rRNA processing protein RimM
LTEPAFDPDTAVTVGRILAPHGVRGEIRVEALTDFPERFEPGSRLYIQESTVVVERARGQGRTLIVKLAGIDDRNGAEALRNAEIKASPRPEHLEEGTFYRDDLIGLEVVDARKNVLGSLTDILATGSNDVYVVRGRRGEILLPATDDVILEVDLPHKRIVVEVIEGLEWQQPKGARAPRRR